MKLSIFYVIFCFIIINAQGDDGIPLFLSQRSLVVDPAGGDETPFAAYITAGVSPQTVGGTPGGINLRTPSSANTPTVRKIVICTPDAVVPKGPRSPIDTAVVGLAGGTVAPTNRVLFSQDDNGLDEPVEPELTGLHIHLTPRLDGVCHPVNTNAANQDETTS